MGEFYDPSLDGLVAFGLSSAASKAYHSSEEDPSEGAGGCFRAGSSLLVGQIIVGAGPGERIYNGY